MRKIAYIIYAIISFTICFLVSFVYYSAKAAPPTVYDIGGIKVSCPIAQLVMGNVDGMGESRRGIISLDIRILREKPVVQTFVFMHECGHQYNGGSEYSADCFAVKHGVYFDWLKQSDLAKICDSFGGPATLSHPGGPARCRALYTCYNKWYHKRWD